MANKYITQILTLIFIVSLIGALYYSWEQSKQLESKNSELINLNKDLKEKSKSLEIAITKLEKERDGYVKLFSSSMDYEEAKKKNTPEAYYKYVKNVGAENFGDTRIIKEISDKLNALMNKTGYVQLIESDGTNIFEEKEKLFKDYDFFQAKSDRSVRRGVIGVHDKVSRNGDHISIGQIVNVLNIVRSGNAAWAEISYHSD